MTIRLIEPFFNYLHLIDIHNTLRISGIKKNYIFIVARNTSVFKRLYPLEYHDSII
jgi:hypothetical protein